MSACWLSEFHWAEGAVEGTMNGLDTRWAMREQGQRQHRYRLTTGRRDHGAERRRLERRGQPARDGNDEPRRSSPCRCPLAASVFFIINT